MNIQAKVTNKKISAIPNKTATIQADVGKIRTIDTSANSVPLRLSSMPTITRLSLTPSVRSNSYVYVDKSLEEGAKISLEELKAMNTKIQTVAREEEVDYSLIDKGDFVYIIK